MCDQTAGSAAESEASNTTAPSLQRYQAQESKVSVTLLLIALKKMLLI